MILGAVGYLVYNGLRTNVYYQTVSELQASGGENGRQVRLAGNVVEDSIVRADGSSEIRFSTPTPAVACRSYQDHPDVFFATGIEVVLEGKYRPDTGLKYTDTMLAKCPLEVRVGGAEVVASSQ